MTTATRPITTAEMLLRASRVADLLGVTQLTVLGAVAYVTGDVADLPAVQR